MQSLPITYGLRQTTAGVRGVSPEYAVMRSETAEFGPVSHPGRRRKPSAGRVSRIRGRPKAVQQHSAGRGDHPHQRPAVRSDRRDAEQGADLELFLSRQALGVHPLHRVRPRRERRQDLFQTVDPPSCTRRRSTRSASCWPPGIASTRAISGPSICATTAIPRR